MRLCWNHGMASKIFMPFIIISSDIQVCLPIIPMVFSLILKSWCAYKHFPYWYLGVVPTNISFIIMCRCAPIPAFPMSFIIINWNPGVPINISHIFFPFYVGFNCDYQHFLECLLNLCLYNASSLRGSLGFEWLSSS